MRQLPPVGFDLENSVVLAQLYLLDIKYIPKIHGTYLNTSATDSHPLSVVPWYSSGGGDTRNRERIWTPTAVRTTITATRRSDIVEMKFDIHETVYVDHQTVVYCNTFVCSRSK